MNKENCDANTGLKSWTIYLSQVLDSSGIRIHYTPRLRAHDAALLGAGIGVSALHVIPPKQRHYRTVGICGSECTKTMIPDDGITIVSVLLHAHGTAKKISLKHIRGNNELPKVSEENSYDVRYQQSRIVPGGRKFLKGDTLITECTYDSTGRDKPILGGYSATQEMCLSFVLYYPRTPLAGCYSMTPAKEFFETFGVREFYGVDMTQVENTFLSSSYVEYPNLPSDQGKESEEGGMHGDDQGVGFMKELVIKEPLEFGNKTFMAHLNEMPWSEPLSINEEMCLSFVLYYPRTPLAGCYSMTPAKEFFETFGVREFYGVDMTQVENTFLSSSYVEYPNLPSDQGKESEEGGMQGDDQGVGFMKELVIKEPLEFGNKTFMAHLNEMPWSEPLLTEQIEKTLYRGMHMTFCKKNDDSWGAPVQIQTYPNFTELTNNDTSEKSCNYKSVRLPSVTKTNAAIKLSLSLSAILFTSIKWLIARYKMFRQYNSPLEKITQNPLREKERLFEAVFP
ncbi:MOXD1-like 1 [Papilio machaon]|uniref:MOXD1-like 1 n=1 Tax=Papilio machaon TaxID=76193 RepID=A0A0N1IAI1_PAPMA|nr:MOXD1-like 1 [Papilio machaon]